MLKKKVADLTRLVNGAFPENSKKPNLTSMFMEKLLLLLF